MLTLLMATRNGARHIGGTLAALGRVSPPPGGWKLVVIDNASTDGAPAIVASYGDRLPLTVLQEPAIGKNAALNTALGHVEGDLVVFTDDDVFPRADWLVQVRKAADAHPECTVFGGTVLPRWEAPPERWVREWVNHAPVFGLTSPARAEGLGHADCVFGPNMAIRADVFRRGARFDEGIGPGGSDYAMGSETQLVSALLRAGHAAWFSPRAIVEHLIRAQHMTRSSVLARAVRFGRGQYRLRGEEGPREPTVLWWGVPRYVYRELASQAVAAVFGALTFNPRLAFDARWAFNLARGHAIEARSEYRRAPQR